MNLRNTHRALLTLICLLAVTDSHALFKDYEILSTDEVRELFSDKTAESYNLLTRRTSFTYYHPNGRVSQERLWRKRSGRWRITEDGRICLKFKKSHTCRHIIKRNNKYYKLLVRKDASKKVVVRYRRFAAGNALAGGK